MSLSTSCSITEGGSSKEEMCLWTRGGSKYFEKRAVHCSKNKTAHHETSLPVNWKLLFLFIPMEMNTEKIAIRGATDGFSPRRMSRLAAKPSQSLAT